MARPARKTDGYRLAPPRHHGTRWEDVNVGKWVVFKFLPSCLIAGSIGLLAVAILRGDGIDVTHVISRFTALYAALGTGGGGLLIGLLGIFKDRHAPHLASLQIDSARNEKTLGEVDGKVVELSKLSGAMTRAIQDTRSDVTAVRSDVADVRREVSQLVGSITQLQMLLVQRTASEASLYPPPTALPPPSHTPRVEPVAAHVTGSSVAAEVITERPDPFDTSRPWTREDTGAIPAVDPDPIPPSAWGPSGPQDDLFRFGMGLTDSVPAVLRDEGDPPPSTDPNLDEHLRGGPDVYRDYYRQEGERGTT